MKLFIDECLSPNLTSQLWEMDIVAHHPRNIGQLKRKDHNVLDYCLNNDLTIVTHDASDFRGLIGDTDLHPGLIILPECNRNKSWKLLKKIVEHLQSKTNPTPANYMVNRVLEIDLDGSISDYELPE